MKLRGAIARVLGRLRGGDEQPANWKRHTLVPAVLQRALPARIGTARYRAGLPDAQAREQSFARISDSYARVLEDQSSFPGHARSIVVDGLTWWVPLLVPGDATAADRYLRRQNFPYRAISQTRELGIGGLMLDLGANNGRMSLPRVVLGDVVAAYCAEPEPLNYLCLVRNVRDNGLNGLVMPDQAAIGDHNGTVKMARAKSPGGHKVIGADVRSRRETIEVPCFTLDTWCERLGIDLRQVSLVKVDTQGFELQVLRGAAHVLSHPHIVWQIEVDLPLQREQGHASDDLFASLRRYFTHWIDLNRSARGTRVRLMKDLLPGLSYLSKAEQPRTDILAFTLAPVAGEDGTAAVPGGLDA